VLVKNQPQPTDPITYDLQPLKGPVHVGDIVAVRLAVNGSAWKYLLAEDPIPSGTEFYVYLLKVVNPGKFAISPAQVGPMYQPQIEATSDPASLEVQP
jgi:uncharacterized protein YfaS (alpha-2-macroglobulin family)